MWYLQKYWLGEYISIVCTHIGPTLDQSSQGGRFATTVSGGSNVRRPMSEDPHWCQWNVIHNCHTRLCLTDNIASLSLQDRAMKWHYYQ